VDGGGLANFRQRQHARLVGNKCRDEKLRGLYRVRVLDSNRKLLKTEFWDAPHTQDGAEVVYTIYKRADLVEDSDGEADGEADGEVKPEEAGDAELDGCVAAVVASVQDEAQAELEGPDHVPEEGNALYAVRPMPGLMDEVILYCEGTNTKIATAHVVQRFGAGLNKLKTEYGTVTLKDASHVGVTIIKNFKNIPNIVVQDYLYFKAIWDLDMEEVEFEVPMKFRAKFA
jgi:hypothetical protein